MKRIFLITLFCGVLLLPLIALWSQGYVFGPNIRVNDDPPGSSSHVAPKGGQRGVAVKGDTVYCLWRDGRSGNGIFFAKSIDDGQSFLPNVQVDDAFGMALCPTLSVGDDGTIYAAWQDIRPPYSYWQIYFSKSTDGGLTFTPDVLVNDTTGDIKNHPHRRPSMAVDSSGVIYIAFDDARDGWYDIFFSKSIDGGMTFLPDVMVNDSSVANIGGRTRPGLAADNSGNVYVVWIDDRYHSWKDIYFSKSTDGGVTFLPDIAASDTDNCVYRLDPSVNVDKRGFLHCVWYQWDTNANIFYTRSRDGGSFFSSPITVNDSAYEPEAQAYPSMCVDDSGIVYSVWEDQRVVFSDEEIFFTLNTDTSNSAFVYPDVQVSDTTNDWSWIPCIAVGDSGKAYILWSDERNGDFDIYFATGIKSGIEEEAVKGEEGRVSVSAPFPNPFSDRVEIKYCIGQSAEGIELKVYDLSGRLIRQLINREKNPGVYTTIWQGDDENGEIVPSGVYFIRMETGSFLSTKKVLLVR